MNDYSDSGSSDLIDLAVAGVRNHMPGSSVEQRLQAQMRQTWQAMSDEPVVISWPSQLVRSTRRRLVAACSVAAAVLVAPLLIYMIFSSQSVYAQVLAGIRNAHTVYAKGIRVRGGQQINVAEIWYEMGRGVREDLGKNGLRIDDGEFEWRYHPDTNTVIKGPSRDPIGAIAELLDPVKSIDKHDGERIPELDTTLNSVQCRAFAVSPTKGANSRIVVWLDDRNRLVRFEEQLRRDEEGWDLDERIDMRYDQPIAEERFTVSFPAETRVIDRTAPLKRFGLEDAIATAQRLGIVLAVHN
ncbi:MAG: hypothetical protein H0T51_15915, partial [Pirellulales bacterium]|nr:hypothetical protein [Pirellulales bacterium]